MLKRFAEEYLYWVAEGAYGHKVFSRSVGLCSGFSAYRKLQRWPSRPAHETFDPLFIGMYGEDDFPFGGAERFISETKADTKHTNKMRLEFCKVIAEYGADVKFTTDDFGNIVITGVKDESS